MMRRPRNTWMDALAQQVRDAWPRPVQVSWRERYASRALAIDSVRNGLRCRLRVCVMVDVVGDILRVWCNDRRQRPAEALPPIVEEVAP